MTIKSKNCFVSTHPRVVCAIVSLLPCYKYGCEVRSNFGRSLKKALFMKELKLLDDRKIVDTKTTLGGIKVTCQSFKKQQPSSYTPRLSGKCAVSHG